MQVFISSTYIDLIEERKAAIEAVLEANHIPAGMELFTADVEPKLSRVNDLIAESDIFIMIIGGRFGALETDKNMGYLQMEYLMARKLKKPIFVIQLSDGMLLSKVKSNRLSISEVFESNNIQLFNKFIKSVSLDRLVVTVDSIAELKLQILRLLYDTEKHLNLNGWIREEKSKLMQENKRLQLELEKEKSKQTILIKQTNRPLPESRQSLLGSFTYEQILYSLTSKTLDVSDQDANEFGFKSKYPTLLEVLMEHHMTLLKGVTYDTGDSLDEMLLNNLIPRLLPLGLMEQTEQMISDYPVEKFKLSKNGLTLVGKIYSGVFEELKI